MAYFKSVHCAAGHHDKCRDGAALSCVCRCGHRRFQEEGREQASWYDDLAADEAAMDRRIIEQLQAANKPVYSAWEDEDGFYIRIRYSASETNDLYFYDREARDDSLAVLLEEVSA